MECADHAGSRENPVADPSVHVAHETARPVIAVTVGDPASVSPEVTAAALSDPKIGRRARLLVVGDVDRMRRAAVLIGSAVGFTRTRSAARARFGADVDVLQPIDLPRDLRWGALHHTEQHGYRGDGRRNGVLEGRPHPVRTS